MAEPDIRVLVSNTGDDSPSGASANKIRDNLQQAFSRRPAYLRLGISKGSLSEIRNRILAELKDIKIDIGANVGFVGVNNGSGGTGGGRVGQRSAIGVGIDYSAADAAKSEAEKLNAISVAHDEWSKKIIATVGRTNTKLKAEAARIPDAVIRDDAVREIDTRTNSVIAIVQRLAKSTDKLVPSDLGPLDSAVNYLNRATSEANALYTALEKLQNKLFAATPTGGVNGGWLNSAMRELEIARGTALDKATRTDNRSLMYGSMAAVEDYSIEAEQFLSKIAVQSGAITSEQEGYWKNVISLIRGATDEYIRAEKVKQAELAKTAQAQEASVDSNSTSAKLRRAAQERMYRNIDMAVNGDKDSKEILAEMRQFYASQEREAERANDALLAIDEKRIASGRRRRAEELRAEEAQARAINKVQEQSWKDHEAIVSRIGQTNQRRRREELNAEKTQAQAINKAQEQAWKLSQQNLAKNRNTATNQKYSVDTIYNTLNTNASSAVIGGVTRTINGIRSEYQTLVQELEKYASRSDQVSEDEKRELGARISKFKELIDLYNKAQMPVSANQSNIKYADKKTAKFDSAYANMVRSVQEFGGDSSISLLQRLGSEYGRITDELIKISNRSDTVTEKEKQNIADRIAAMQREVSEYVNSRRKQQNADESAARSQKRLAESNKASNQDYAKSIRMDTKRYSDFYSTKTNIAEYQRAQELLSGIDVLLQRCETDSVKWTQSQKKEISLMLTELGRLKTATEQATKGFTITVESEAQARLGAAQFEQYLSTLKPKVFQEMAGDIQNIRLLFAKKTPDAIKQANAALKNFKASMKAMGYEGGNILTYIGEKIKTFGTYLISSTMTMGVIRTVRQTVENVKAMDSALTDLRIVTGNTKEETRELIGTYNDMAKALGTTTTAVAEGATDWLRQGYDAVESAELLKQSMTLSIVGAMESEDATNALTAAMKGYSLAVEDASSVVDKFFKVDMSAATSSSDLALALAKTAANAKLAGMSLDDVIGQLAVVNETMKENGEETGSFYNTMLSRMGNIKAGRVNDMESGEDLSDVESTLRNMDIMLRDSSGQFRNFGIVLDEVGEKWDSFSNIQQRAIATAFAGTRQQTRFLSLMSGWEQAGKYATAAANSAGVAAQKLTIYQDSIEAKSNKMTAAFEAMSMSLLSDGLVGGFYDFGAAIFNAVAAMPAFLKDGAAMVALITGLTTGFNMLQKSTIGVGISKFGTTLGWPKTTGDNIVPIYSKKTA